MKKIATFIFLSIFLSSSAFAVRFSSDLNAEYRLSNGLYVYYSPSLYFERGAKNPYDFNFYAPGLSLNVGYSYAHIHNKSIPSDMPNYRAIEYNALYVGLSFLNKFTLDSHTQIILSAFGDVRLGGRLTFLDGGNTGCGIKADFKLAVYKRLFLGMSIIGAYSFAGDFRGFDAGLGASLTWFI